MSNDPELVAETRGWLHKAHEDLELAQMALDRNPPFISPAAFHTQQCAEKLLKAFLTWNSETFKKTHDLKELGDPCVKLDLTLEPIVVRVAPISAWAIETRYPSIVESETSEQVASAIETVRELFRQILSRLPEETHP
jgi:HEPN domain-containing protein